MHDGMGGLNRESVNTFTRQVTNTISEGYSPGINVRPKPLRIDTFGVGIGIHKLVPGGTGSSHDTDIMEKTDEKRMTQIDEHIAESFLNTPAEKHKKIQKYNVDI